MSADYSPPTQASATFAPAHEAIPEDAVATASPSAGHTNSSPPSSAAAVKAAMQARRKSRGLGEGLRPDFVFPKPQTAATAAPSASTSGHAATNSVNGLHKDLSRLSLTSADPAVTVSSTTLDNHPKPVSVQPLEEEDAQLQHNRASSLSANGSLAPPKTAQQHLKTHYRTHSRNGSTVTVQDLKQAIAAVSMDLLELPPITAVSTGSTTTITTATAMATETGASGATSVALSGSSGLAITTESSSSGSPLAATSTGTSLSSTKSKLSTVSVSADPDPESSKGITASSSLPPLSSFSSSISSQNLAAASSPRGL
ncbi:hypothetical protein BGX29_003928, partial [Mortierella sp. GBA35]